MTTATDHTERMQLLQALEATHARGLVALDRRNSLIAELHAEGQSLQSLASVLNGARAKQGVRPVTRYAVFAAIKRRELD